MQLDGFSCTLGGGCWLLKDNSYYVVWGDAPTELRVVRRAYKELLLGKLLYIYNEFTAGITIWEFSVKDNGSSLEVNKRKFEQSQERVDLSIAKARGLFEGLVQKVDETGEDNEG